MKYGITKKGKTKVGWGATMRPPPLLSFPEKDILSYLRKRKTLATLEEISRGAGYSKHYTSILLTGLKRSGLVKSQ